MFSCVALFSVQYALYPSLYTILLVSKENHEGVEFARVGSKREAGIYRRTVSHGVLRH
jgi:hypothetical protein